MLIILFNEYDPLLKGYFIIDDIKEKFLIDIV